METWKDKAVFYVQNSFMINEQRLPRAIFVNQSIVDPLFNLQNEFDNPDLDLLKIVYLEEEFPGMHQGELDILPKYEITHFENKSNKITIYLELESNSEGFLVLSEIYYPGWRVFVNGKEKEVLKANSLFRAVHISEQSNRIEFIFKPRSFIIGVSISSITLFVMIWLLFYSKQWERKDFECK